MLNTSETNQQLLCMGIADVLYKNVTDSMLTRDAVIHITNVLQISCDSGVQPWTDSAAQDAH